MEFTLLEEAVLHNALTRYCAYCEACLSTPGNEKQEVFIRGDLQIARELCAKFDRDYSSKGGNPSLL